MTRAMPWRALSAAAILFIIVPPALANRAPPRLQPPAEGAPQLSIVVDDNATSSRIVLPAGAAKADAAETAAPPTFARAQTMVIGGALTMAIMCGGLWLVRSRSKGGTGSAAALLITASVIGVVVSSSMGDIPSPGPRPPKPRPVANVPADTKTFTLAEGLDVAVEQGEGKNIVLHLTRADAAKIAAGIKTLPESPVKKAE